MNTRFQLLWVWALAALSVQAQALTIVDPVEGKNSFVKISAKEQTRIAVENGKLRSLIHTDGDLVVEKDGELGQAFIRPVVLDKPINVRVVTSSNHTYSLILQPVDVPQEDVIIRDPALKAEKQGLSVDNRGTPYEKGLKTLITAMAAEEPASTVDVKQVDQEFGLWQGTRFILRAIYTERNLVGEKYTLHNVSPDRIRIVEQELYRKGVLAVAIENMTLDPGQSTNVYVVKGGQ